ncbi:MAG TPA: DUF2269 family protein [Dehalococcoidia bacterium]|nr:DUF2269 family protein [Dehalococcoidia bacterium]
MTSVDILRWVHFLSLFLMTAGLGAVMVPLWRGWREDDVERQLVAFEDALTGHRAGLLPGTIAVGASGIFLAADADYNFFTTGWLLALELVYLFVLFVCVPILGHALNRVQVETLKSRKKGKPSEELQEVLADNVPIVFSLLILFLIPVMAWLAEFKPF